MTSHLLAKSLLKFSALAILILASSNMVAMTRLSRLATQSISYLKPTIKNYARTIFGFKPRFIHIDKAYVKKAYDLFYISPPQKISHEQLKATYRKLLLAHHPDLNYKNPQEATRKTQEINEAFNFLMQPQFYERAHEEEEYNEYIRQSRIEFMMVGGFLIAIAPLTFGFLTWLHSEIDKPQLDYSAVFEDETEEDVLPLIMQSLNRSDSRVNSSNYFNQIFATTLGLTAIITGCVIAYKLGNSFKKTVPSNSSNNIEESSEIKDEVSDLPSSQSA